MLFDYILNFQSKEAAQVSIPAWFDVDGEPFAQETYSGAMSVNLVKSDGDFVDGYSLMITTAEPSDDIFNLDACLVEIKRPDELTQVDNCVTRSKPQWQTFLYPEPQYSGVMYNWGIAV